MPLNTLFSRFLLIATVSVLSACAMNTKTTSSTNTPADASASSATPSLSAYHWDLTGAHDANGVAQTQWVPPKTRDGAPLRLSFNEQRLSVSGLCNQLGAGYSTDANKIKISGAVSTMMACSDSGLMQYERAFGQRLPQAVTWQITQGTSSPLLTLRFADGAQWTLTGTPTNETLYGGPGETIFLEIAPQRMACSHPGIPNMQCLQVREIHFDAQGLQTGQGEWQAFYSEIEGYTHQPGVRNVLRVKRYERTQVPADASRYVYVLDLVVQSAKE